MKNSVKTFWKLFFGGFAAFIIFLLLCNYGVFGKMPSIDDIQNPSASLSSQVYAQDGSLMGKYYLEDRVNVDFKDISPNIVNALIATEDERFYKHSGIDLRAIGRAVRGFGRDGGASTITMQTAKNLFTENWATRNFLLRFIQKIKESIIAVKLEINFTKTEIVSLYLNSVEYSDHVYGIRNAAKTFFQKEPDRVSVEEAAMLVGMVNAPSLYNPRRNPKNSIERRNIVLDQLARNKYLKSNITDSLKQMPIDMSHYKKLDETNGLGPYFRMILGEELKKWCEEHQKSNGDNYNLYKDGLKIYTTINPRMQLYAEEAVAKHMSYMQKLLNQQQNIKDKSVWKGYENVIEAAIKHSDRWYNSKKDGMGDSEIRKSFDEKIPMKIFSWNSKREKDTIMSPYDSIMYCKQMLQAGFMAMDPLSGEVRAWVGGIDFKTFKYDHVNYNTKRQVGSTIKPLLYSLAIEHSGLTPNSIVQDIQQHFGAYGNVPATSKSCSGATITMAEALAKSRNCATAFILKQLDPTGNNSAKLFVDFLNNKCGLQTNIGPNPSIALGACEISLFEMMQAYSMLPGRGFNVKPIFMTRIVDRNGNTLETFSPMRREVISELTSYHVINMMKGVVDYGTARNLKLSYDITGDIAGKTGTTNSNTDAWFMGYSPQLLAGSWVGCDDQFIHFTTSNYDGQGARAAMPIWAYFYEKVSHDPNIQSIDPSVTFAKPDVSINDINYDNIMGIQPTNGTILEDAGNGTAQDYGVPNQFRDNNDIKAESNFNLNKPKENKPEEENPYINNPVGPLPKPAEDKSKIDLLKNPADKPKKPKATLPLKGENK